MVSRVGIPLGRALRHRKGRYRGTAKNQARLYWVPQYGVRYFPEVPPGYSDRSCQIHFASPKLFFQAALVKQRPNEKFSLDKPTQRSIALLLSGDRRGHTCPRSSLD